jgi:hypothetical protein
MNVTTSIASPAARKRAALNRSTLTVLNLPMHDPRVRPLLDELAVEYDSRYGDLFGRGAAADELNRYPASEFKGPGGALLVVQENGESATTTRQPSSSGSGPTRRTAAAGSPVSSWRNWRPWRPFGATGASS